MFTRPPQEGSYADCTAGPGGLWRGCIQGFAPPYDIVGVFCPPDSPKGKVDPLKEVAQEAGMPVIQPRKMKDPEAYEQMKKLAPDLAILAFVTDIVPGRVLALPRLGQYLLSSFPASQTPGGFGHQLGGDRWRC